ncbi:uncharacterized protein LOC123322603 [Coccinella septempunctata]|uniref:uncharacterized protein LOC123322603 n=1 Tax=Coccinella septempunctata TaxID=41139 RepID=UPI001D08A755|nr:uncharacterized protein LOC123322603 [Coccinella septempunctata]
MINTCKECGCTCKHCGRVDNDIHLHLEIENLKQKLAERDSHIIRMETNFLNESTVDSDEMMLLKDELLTLQDKHKRLSDAHKRVQRVNQGLEDKLLKLVDACETDKSALAKDVAVLSEKLAEANYTVKKLTESNERYKKDVNVAIQFLQCKQSNFVGHKFDTLPPEIQGEVSVFMTHKKKPEERKLIEPKSIKVPIPTFPPTAMFYSVPKSPKEERRIVEEAPPSTPPVDVVSAAIMAKVLEERQKERMCIKHCDTCTCSKNLKLTDPNRHHDVGTQTDEFKQSCKTCKEASFQILKLPRSADIANAKMPNFELENCNNIVKVQPNNFLVEKSSSNASSLIDLDINLNSESVVLEPNVLVSAVGVECNNKINQPRLDNSFLKKHEGLQGQPLPTFQNFKISSEVPSNLNSKTIASFTPLIPHSAQIDRKNQAVKAYGNKLNLVHAHKTTDSDISIVNSVRKDVEDKTEDQNQGTNFQNNKENFQNLDRSKYQEMEENVKRFLFKKTELWKEQSESFPRNDEATNDLQQTFSHTQTEI